MKHYSLLSLLIISLYLCIPSVVIAEDIEMVNHPVNISGLTGLLFTTAPYTLAPGTIETGVSILTESSIRPDYRITEYPISVTAGITKNSELALRGSYYDIKEGPTVTATTIRNTGDVELSYKWNFMPQAEYSVVPGLALIVTGIVPTGNIHDRVATSVAHWAARIGLSTGTEFQWKDHVLGIYADAQLAGQDITEKRLRDIYEIVNAGMLLPISKYQNLQMFIEYSLLNRKDKITISGGDYTAFTYGLRLVGERFNLTIGTQFMHKKTEGYDSSGRVIGLMSMKF